ncbi:GATOR complex protein MIOS [Eurytemora carolleeae]|uniref:GATOR complex protein MIOS n=1 Tax=Eurytemora carolleeae TaxID=1294199 RepID=UPI000C792C73|nr:GATOR complex protein MIOS [Eurytemora carolleeae]|eukprot:XP_023330654.1 GATOR complex protein MIOS-like [Eurytemora affinis]
MNERRFEVAWVPSIPDQFVTWGSDLRLYQVVDGEHSSRGLEKEQIGVDRYAELVNCVTEPHYIKSVSIWRGEGVRLAVGQATGRVSLISLSDDLNLEFASEKEFNPKQSRPCSALAWHPTQYTLLAAGYEKVRTEDGIVVWDLSQSQLTEKPLHETGHGDHCTSLSWAHTQPLLVAGLNTKTVKIFDSRNGMKTVNQTQTRATYGLSVDPGSDYRISGYSESSVVIWDTRNFEKPIITLNSPHQVTKVSWCPSRPGLLASSVKDSGSILLRDIMSWAVSQEDGEASVTERTIQPPGSQIGNIADFAWHPSRENTLLAMGTLSRFTEWTVADRLTLNFSARHSLIWSSGASNLLRFEPTEFSNSESRSSDEPRNYLEICDIGLVMQSRAKAGYSGDTKLTDLSNFKLGSELDTVWTWVLQSGGNAFADLISPNTRNAKFLGVRTLLYSSAETSQAKLSNWTGLDSAKPIRTYHSTERELILKLCGWDKKKMGKKNLNEISRNAAIAVFNLDMKAAIEILKSGCTGSKGVDSGLSSNLSMVCVAVSGYSSEGSKLWKEVVANSLPLLPDPALKSLFSFLTSEDESYSDVLSGNNLSFLDRVAFASRFLSDKLLLEYLEKERSKLLLSGSLEGLILSRTHQESIEVLQAYVDRSGDIQTASLISLKILPPEILRSAGVVSWIDNYRQMLDQWNMFGVRSELDISLSRSDPSWETQLQGWI